jgi:outer membrane protein assembly factor BamB
MLTKRSWVFLGAATVLLAVIGVAVALTKLDFERFDGHAERMRKLQETPLADARPEALPGDWPQWRGPNGDGVSLETNLLGTWPEGGLRKLWERPLGRGFSCPVVARGRLFTMAQEDDPPSESVLCLDAETGAEVWRFRYANRYEERMGDGPRSTPAVDGDFVFTLGPTGIFHCLRADTGEKVWRHDLLEEFHAPRPQYGVSCSPLVEGDRVFVMPGGPAGGSVAAFDKHTGALLWKALDDPAGYSSPIAVTAAGVRQVLFFTNTALVSLAPEDGKLLWRHPWETPHGFNIATPLAFDNYAFISSAYTKGCTLLEITASADGSLAALPVYTHNRMRNYFASSIRKGGYIYGFDNNDVVCMDVRTGKVAWREEGIRTFKKGSLTMADDRLIILSESGKLSLAEATPDGYHEISSCDVSRNKCWTVPIVAGGKLYVRDEGRLVCLDLRK